MIGSLVFLIAIVFALVVLLLIRAVRSYKDIPMKVGSYTKYLNIEEESEE